MATGELTLEPLDFVVLVLTVRSRAGAIRGAETGGAADLESSSGNRENQSSDAMVYESPWNMGEVSKLSVMNGDCSISGEVMLVNVVEGGADWRGSAKMSLGDTVRVELGTELGLMTVKAEAGASQGLFCCWKPANRLAPESNELLLFKSARSVSVSLDVWKLA
jgi:hypothetical protein